LRQPSLKGERKRKNSKGISRMLEYEFLFLTVLNFSTHLLSTGQLATYTPKTH